MVRIGNFLFHYRNGLFPAAFVLLVWRGHAVFENDFLAAGVGFGIAMIGQGLRALTIGLAYIICGGKNRQVYAEDLVTGGIFSHCRNPLYVGNLVIIAGVGVAANSLLFMVVGVPFFLFAYRAIVAAEEDFLRRKFGQQFEDYCARVNRFVPALAGIGRTIRGMEFNWKRLIVKEYGSTFAWTAGMLGFVLKNLWWSGHYTLQSPLLWTLCGALVLVLVAYVVARYLKKSRILQAG